jgi:hypothetical protein
MSSPLSAQVLRLIEDQSRNVNQQIDALLLVGGFSGSEYLFKRVQVCQVRGASWSEAD